MILSLRLLDVLQSGAPTLPPVEVHDQTFGKAPVAVDNQHFYNCCFHGSHFWFSGGPCQFDNCEIDDEITVHLTGAAARGQALLSALDKVLKRG